MMKKRDPGDISISMEHMKQLCKGILYVDPIFFSVAMNVILVVMCQSLYSCSKASLQL